MGLTNNFETILITGSGGFIAQSLIKRLKFLNFRIIEFNKFSKDISALNSFEPFKEEKIDYLIHLAGKISVPESWDNPALYYQVNVMGTEHALEFCRKKNIPMTYLSSFIYGNQTHMPIEESRTPVCSNPYAHSKLLAEQLCEFYSQMYGVSVVVLRPFNIYGPLQNPDFLIPMLLTQVKSAEKIVVKDSLPKRDYTYIADLLDAIIATLNHQEKFNIYNVGSGKSYAVFEVINLIQMLLGTNKEVVDLKIKRANEMYDCVANISKISAAYGWVPKYDLTSGLFEMINVAKK